MKMQTNSFRERQKLIKRIYEAYHQFNITVNSNISFYILALSKRKQREFF